MSITRGAGLKPWLSPSASLGLLLICVAGFSQVQAGSLAVTVFTEDGEAVVDAVVSAVPVADVSGERAGGSTRDATQASIRQKAGQFQPFVTAVERGTAISFPNDDDYHHNVYSFSSARRFQLPLYKGDTPAPVLFDKTGTVVLGCNIHDWMVAYVRVLDTPYFAVSGEQGKAAIIALPKGEYDVSVWHPQRRKRRDEPTRISVADATLELEFAIRLKPQWRNRP